MDESKIYIASEVRQLADDLETKGGKWEGWNAKFSISREPVELDPAKGECEDDGLHHWRGGDEVVFKITLTR